MKIRTITAHILSAVFALMAVEALALPDLFAEVQGWAAAGPEQALDQGDML